MPALVVIRNWIDDARTSMDPTVNEDFLWPGDVIGVLDPAVHPDPGTGIWPPDYICVLVADATKEQLEYLLRPQIADLGNDLFLMIRKRQYSIPLDLAPAATKAALLDPVRRANRDWFTVTLGNVLGFRTARSTAQQHLKDVQAARGGALGRLVR